MLKIIAHKHALLFAGGVATAVIGKKVLESETVKNAATEAMAGVMTIKKDAEDTLAEMKAEAENIANGEEKTKIEVE